MNMNSKCILAIVALSNAFLVSIDPVAHADSPLGPEAELADI